MELAFAAAEVNQASAGPSYEQICALEPDPLEESLVIDNSTGALGSPLVVGLGGQPVCGDPTAPAGAPVVNWIAGPAGDTLNGLNIDLRANGACGVPQRRPGLHVEGPGTLYIDMFTLQGTVDYAIGNGIAGPAGTVFSNGFGHFIGNCEGSAVRTSGDLTLQNVGIAGCRLDGTGNANALLEAVEPQGHLILNDVVVFGNLVDGGLALLLDDWPGVVNTTFAANGLGPGIPLVRSGLPLSTYALGPDGPVDLAPTAWKDNVFSRNRHVSGTGSFVLPEQPATVVPSSPMSNPSCPIGAVGRPWATTGSPFEAFPAADGPLMHFDGSMSTYVGEDVQLFRNSFVANVSGSSPLVLIETPRTGLNVQALQNTAAENEAAAFIEVASAGPGWSLYSMRNLWVGTDSPAEPFVLAASAPTVGITTMNVGPVNADWLQSPQVPPVLIDGPHLEHSFVGGEFVDAALFGLGSPCLRHQALCPDADAPACVSRAQSNRRMICALDRAAEFLPSSAFVAGLGHPWPWDTTFFEASPGSWESPGASGWRCEGAESTVDSFSEGVPQSV